MDSSGSPVTPESGDLGQQNRGADSSFEARLRKNARTATGLVVAVTFVALVLRVVFLGDRIAHWDEARVGFWITHYVDTGSFAYRRIIHGPFIQHVNRWLFPIVGTNDFTMRLPVALISAVLPLSALMFRNHLRKAELVAMALFLAVNPVVLYYSRFMRSDLLVATFMFVALGCLVRFYDTRRFRYVYAASILMACGFAAKENAILYVLTWLGALGLLADQALYRPRNHESGFELLLDRYGSLVYRALRVVVVVATMEVVAVYLGVPPFYATAVLVEFWIALTLLRYLALTVVPGIQRIVRTVGRQSDEWNAKLVALFDESSSAARAEIERLLGIRSIRSMLHVVGVSLVFFALSLFFYAPRGAGLAGLGYPPATVADHVTFWQAVADPTQLPALIDHTAHRVYEQYGAWFGQAGDAGNESILDQYVEFLGRYVEVMGRKAAPLTVLAVAGFAIERYGARTSRNLVMFAAYGGFVSVLGYPLGTDIFGAWIVVHALVPLSIPAGVGLARLYYWGQSSFDADDRIGVGAAAFLLLLIGGQIAGVTAASVYTNPQADDNELVQYAQPGGDARAELQAIRRAAADDTRSGADVVLYYGEQDQYYMEHDALVEEHVAAWNESRLNWEPVCSKWFNSLPLPWYIASSDADATCSRTEANLTETVDGDPPGVIVTLEGDKTVPRDRLNEEYTNTTHHMRTRGTHMTFWVHESVRESDDS